MIQKISNYNTNYSYGYSKSNMRKNHTTFMAHPDFIKIKQNYDITASSYFRRGVLYGSPSDEFSVIVRTLERVFQNTSGEKVKMLISGIGDSQEPFSYLAVINDIIKNKNLNDILDLHINDLQDKPDKEKLFEDSYFDCYWKPNYASKSFVQEYIPYPDRYRVKDEIFEFLNDTYANPQKSKWEKPIQEAVKEYPSELFDLISVNNTFPYILMVADSSAVLNKTIVDITRILKSGGIFITDPYNLPLLKNAGVVNCFRVLEDGIFVKK